MTQRAPRARASSSSRSSQVRAGLHATRLEDADADLPQRFLMNKRHVLMRLHRELGLRWVKVGAGMRDSAHAALAK